MRWASTAGLSGSGRKDSLLARPRAPFSPLLTGTNNIDTPARARPYRTAGTSILGMRLVLTN